MANDRKQSAQNPPAHESPQRSVQAPNSQKNHKMPNFVPYLVLACVWCVVLLVLFILDVCVFSARKAALIYRWKTVVTSITFLLSAAAGTVWFVAQALYASQTGQNMCHYSFWALSFGTNRATSHATNTVVYPLWVFFAFAPAFAIVFWNDVNVTDIGDAKVLRRKVRHSIICHFALVVFVFVVQLLFTVAVDLSWNQFQNYAANGYYPQQFMYLGFPVYNSFGIVGDLRCIPYFGQAIYVDIALVSIYLIVIPIALIARLRHIRHKTAGQAYENTPLDLLSSSLSSLMFFVVFFALMLIAFIIFVSTLKPYQNIDEDFPPMWFLLIFPILAYHLQQLVSRRYTVKPCKDLPPYALVRGVTTPVQETHKDLAPSALVRVTTPVQDMELYSRSLDSYEAEEAKELKDLPPFPIELRKATEENLDQIMRFTPLKDELKKFAHSEHSVENIEFYEEWLHVSAQFSEYVSASHDSNRIAPVFNAFNFLFENFIQKAAPMEVNISAAARAEVERCIGNCKLGISTLDDVNAAFQTAVSEVRLLILTDTFPRFVRWYETRVETR